MDTFKKIWAILMHKKTLKKFAAYGILILWIYLLRDLLIIFLMTFIFAYLIYSLAEYVKSWIDTFVDKVLSKKTTRQIWKQALSLNVIIIIQYIGVFILLFIFATQVLPQLIKELYDLSKTMPFLQNEIQNITEKLEEIRFLNTELWGSITQIITDQDIKVVTDILLRAKSVGTVFVEIFLSFILSIIFIFDREKIIHYFKGMKSSNFHFLYEEYEIILERGLKSFGFIIKAQSIIASVNTLLTAIGLFTIGYVYGTGFPYILSLALLVFVLGFVPVLGTFLSSIPLILIAFLYVWGLNAALTVVALVVIVHAVEAYYLNPKIFASFLELPVGLTFLILIISEHFLWVAGLLVGVSVFYFIMGILSDADTMISKTKKKIED